MIVRWHEIEGSFPVDDEDFGGGLARDRAEDGHGLGDQGDQEEVEEDVVSV